MDDILLPDIPTPNFDSHIISRLPNSLFLIHSSFLVSSTPYFPITFPPKIYFLFYYFSHPLIYFHYHFYIHFYIDWRHIFYYLSFFDIFFLFFYPIFSFNTLVTTTYFYDINIIIIFMSPQILPAPRNIKLLIYFSKELLFFIF